MPDSYQISVVTPELHHGKRHSAQRQAGVAAVRRRWPGRCNLAPAMHVLAVVAAGLLGVAGCGGVESLFVGHGCNDSESSSWDLHEPTDPSTTLMIEDCRMDVGACDALCTSELDANNQDFSEEGGTLTGCTVRFDGSTIHVQADYDIPDDAPGCEPEGFGEPDAGGGGPI
jgi:hypothetical protein